MKLWQWFLLDLLVWMAIYLTAVELIDDKSWSVLAAMLLVSITSPILQSLKPGE